MINTKKGKKGSTVNTNYLPVCQILDLAGKDFKAVIINNVQGTKMNHIF